jgi:hypothetical protein
MVANLGEVIKMFPFRRQELSFTYAPDFEITLTICYSLLKIQHDRVILKLMLRKLTHVFISILLLLPLLSGMPGFPQWVDNDLPSFQKTCDMDHCDMDNCNPDVPKCPLCPSSGSFIQLFRQEMADYLPTPTSSFILLTLGTLSDQGVVRAIFHPPTSIL